MARPKSPKSSEAPKSRTTQRTYRFDTALFEAFEEDCARHLANPKLVLEALILQWLDADPEQRAKIAKLHQAKFGNSAGQD